MLTKLRHYYELTKAKLRGALKSWTIWFNGVMASMPLALEYAQAQFPFLREFLPDDLYGPAMLAIAAGNLVLRFKTNRALENK